MDLVSQVHAGLRVDGEKKLQLEGEMPGKRRILVDNDATLLRWFKENGLVGHDHLHLFVHPMNHTPEPLLDEPDVHVASQSYNESYRMCLL